MRLEGISVVSALLTVRDEHGHEFEIDIPNLMGVVRIHQELEHEFSPILEHPQQVLLSSFTRSHYLNIDNALIANSAHGNLFTITPKGTTND